MSSSPIHPIAGCGALEGTDQLAYDRRWLVVDETGRWLDRGRCPALAQIDVSVRFGYLVVRAPGMLRMDIPMDVIEDDDSVEAQALVGDQAVRVVDEGELAAAWFTDLLGQACRLAKVHPLADAVRWPT
ncbi:MOSC domain-containing protein [Alcaligenaceae bacterium CGII-47]|nr:MOSC domain-containing protein [Alcaligenaceae bacterium CGII-47]